MDLYFEMYSGIAGDMTIAALLDLGASKEKLVDGINSLGLDGYELVFERAKNTVTTMIMNITTNIPTTITMSTTMNTITATTMFTET